MKVFIDLIFLTNFAIDGLTLWATARTRKLKVKPARLIAAAFLGGLYVVMMFIPPLHLFFTFGVKVLFSMAMIWTAFGFGDMRRFLRNLGAFYLVNFVAAGTVMAVHFFFQSSHEVWNGILFSQSGGLQFKLGIGIVSVLVVVPMALAFYRIVFRVMEKREKMSVYLVEVKVEAGEFCTTCTGLIDTGNQLFDPLTRTPVMIMEASAWKEVLPESWLAALTSASTEQILNMAGSVGAQPGTLPDDWQARLRIVPYRGIQKGTSWMVAVKPDKVTIWQQDRPMVAGKVLIGLKGESLCADGTYHAIVHPDLVAGLDG